MRAKNPSRCRRTTFPAFLCHALWQVADFDVEFVHRTLTEIDEKDMSNAQRIELRLVLYIARVLPQRCHDDHNATTSSSSGDLK
jgi:hypothetical protein